MKFDRLCDVYIFFTVIGALPGRQYPFILMQRLLYVDVLFSSQLKRPPYIRLLAIPDVIHHHRTSHVNGVLFQSRPHMNFSTINTVELRSLLILETNTAFLLCHVRGSRGLLLLLVRITGTVS